MSLDWSTDRCDPPLPQTEEESASRHALVWACVGLDLQGITKNNIDEWMFRIYYSQEVGVRMLDIPDDWTKAYMRRTLERWVGLGTNVITRPRKQWLARMTSIVERRVSRDVEHSNEEEEQKEHA